MRHIVCQVRRLIAPVAIVAVSLALTACGGGGNQPLPTQPPVGTKAAAAGPAGAASPAAAPTPTGAAQPAAATQPGAPAKPAGDPAAGQQAISRYGCGGCHTIPGVQGAAGNVGPNLGGVSKLPVIANTSTQMTPDNLAKWIMNPQSIKPGTTMPTLGVNQTDAQNISAYLYTLQ